MNNKTYDILKWVAQILLPAIATLYMSLAKVWALPYAQEIVGTIIAIDTFLGILLGISTIQYNKMDRTDGILQIDENNPEKDQYLLTIITDLDELKNKDKIELKIDSKADLSQK